MYKCRYAIEVRSRMIPYKIYFFDLVDMDRKSKYDHHHRTKTQMLLNTCLTSMTSTYSMYKCRYAIEVRSNSSFLVEIPKEHKTYL
jgi:hypothetical protein